MKHIRYRILLRESLQGIAVLLLLLLAACSDSDTEPEEPTPPEPVTAEITLDADTESLQSVEASGGSVTVNLTATAEWTATVEDASTNPWLSVSPASGKAGKTTATLTIAANESPEERSASVLFVCGEDEETLTVTQQQGDVLAVSQEVYELTAAESTIDVTVQANVPYTTKIAADWITAVPSRSLTEETLSFQVAANEDTESREGTITFTSEDGSLTRTVTVKQAGEDLYLEVTPGQIDAPAEGGTYTLDIRTNAGNVSITTEGTAWISVQDNQITVAPNADRTERTSTIVVTADVLSQTVGINQAGKQPSEADGQIEDFDENEEEW